MRKNWPMTIAGILLCLVLFTTSLVSGLYARYTAKGSSYDSARVIKFGNLQLTEIGNYQLVDGRHQYKIIPGVNLKKDINVSFTGSESATYVFLEMNTTGKWEPTDYLTLSHFIIKDDISGDEIVSFDINNQWDALGTDGTNTYVYYMILDSNDNLDVDFIANDGQIVVSDEITKEQVSNIATSGINVQAHVVQVGEFKTHTDAWESVSKK